ncbi:MAG: aminoacyl-tRNA hydrolase [Candidatus Nealsonbacteria bacterium]|nr:aminoacyl-tRNA hydrolase [Candidatus Nealsonbacteria bacterium]
MILIVGLGNPGPKYKYSRHNIGFRVVDEIAANFQLPERSEGWEMRRSLSDLQSIFSAQVSKGKIGDKKVILAKPQTFMNLSGKSVKPLIQYLLHKKAMAKICKSLFVIHDDIDLPLGKIRIAKGRGAAGHKGVESIIKELGTKNFVRFRIGIQPKFGKPKSPERFVLQKFNKDEEKILKEIIKKTIEAIELFLKHGLEKAKGTYNIISA